MTRLSALPSSPQPWSALLDRDAIALRGGLLRLVRSGATPAQAQALTDRDSGALLVRDAGSPLDTRWVHGRRDLPRLVRAGRHLARPKRYLRHYGLELDDVAQLPEAVRREARQGDGWVKIVGDWIDRDLGAQGDLRPL